MKDILITLRQQFNDNIDVKPITEGKIQLWLPVYYEDGDMVDVYIESIDDKTYRISDGGMTIMKLSYSYDINTDSKKKILNQIVKANGLTDRDGIIEKEVPVSGFYRELLSFGHTLIRISTMAYFKREMIKNMFYEMVDEYVSIHLSHFFLVEKQFVPIIGKEEYTVDYRISDNRDIFLYAVKDSSKARLVTICEQTFKLNQIESDSVVIYEDFSNIQSMDQKRILNATGKQFTSLNEFTANGIEYLRKRTA